MKKWYYWFLLTLVFAAGGLINYFEGRSFTGSIVQVVLTTLLALIQFFCEKHGDQGRRIFRIISIIVIAALAGWMLIMLLNR